MSAIAVFSLLVPFLFFTGGSLGSLSFCSLQQASPVSRVESILPSAIHAALLAAVTFCKKVPEQVGG